MSRRKSDESMSDRQAIEFELQEMGVNDNNEGVSKVRLTGETRSEVNEAVYETGTRATASTEPIERIQETKNHFMELMERRHRNALAVIEIENMLSQEDLSFDEYPDIQSPENIDVKAKVLKALEPVMESLSKAGLIDRRSRVVEAVNSYLTQKVLAQRAENYLREVVLSNNGETDAEGMGAEFFFQTVGKKPVGRVEVHRREGYFIVSLTEDEDYFSYFGTSWPEKRSSAGSTGGVFHRARRFSSGAIFTVDTIAVRGPFSNSIVDHERQHFINHSVFNVFSGLETEPIGTKEKKFPTLVEKATKSHFFRHRLALIKDELLAYIRDGSESDRATNFIGLPLYSHLTAGFSEDEHREVVQLLKDIKAELDQESVFLQYIDRDVLVYHLIDVSLLKFPERVKAVYKFYAKKLTKFEDLVPHSSSWQNVADLEARLTLSKLDFAIYWEYTTAHKLITSERDANNAKISSEEAQTELNRIWEEMVRLKKKYDHILQKCN